LLTQTPSNSDLVNIICNSTEEYKSKAWEQLLTQKPSRYYLDCIICNSTKEYKTKAEELLK